MGTKRWLMIILLILVLASLAISENIYQYDSLTIDLDVGGQFSLVPENSGSSVKEAMAELLLYPRESYRQQLLEIETGSGQIKDNKIIYSWDHPSTGKKSFGYAAKIKTKNLRNKVKTRINFPIEESLSGYEKYLLPTETIDSDHPKISAQANKLAEGQDDLFKVTFLLANWVEENVKYDLNTMTSEASQKASWVMENKQGVCDEMTSLFIAMCRSLGIPARFVSGISYTTSDLFTEKWQSHGWAEVYFPKVGWVSFDTAFGEYGYIDVTHFQLSEETDPSEPSTRFEWLADDVDLKSEPLEFKVSVQDHGSEAGEDLVLGLELLGKAVNFGSYNLVKGQARNTADYYLATTLQLAVPKEIQVIGKNKKTILLMPKEARETYWIIKVPSGLDQNFWYSFPTQIYSEKNISAIGEFRAEKGQAVYTLEEAEELSWQPEEKGYSQKVSLDCEYLKEVSLNENLDIKCVLKNIGNTVLEKVSFCLGTSCKVVNLGIGQKQVSETSLKADQAGWNKVMVSAENGLIEKKVSLGYLVLDTAKAELNIKAPSETVYGQKFVLELEIAKSSLSNPKMVMVTADGFGSENQWKIEELKDQEKIQVEFDGQMLSWNNKIDFVVEWKDQKGKTYSETKEVRFPGRSSGLKSSVMMFLNWMMKAFY